MHSQAKRLVLVADHVVQHHVLHRGAQVVEYDQGAPADSAQHKVGQHEQQQQHRAAGHAARAAQEDKEADKGGEDGDEAVEGRLCRVPMRACMRGGGPFST